MRKKLFSWLVIAVIWLKNILSLNLAVLCALHLRTFLKIDQYYEKAARERLYSITLVLPRNFIFHPMITATADRAKQYFNFHFMQMMLNLRIWTFQ